MAKNVLNKAGKLLCARIFGKNTLTHLHRRRHSKSCRLNSRCNGNFCAAEKRARAFTGNSVVATPRRPCLQFASTQRNVDCGSVSIFTLLTQAGIKQNWPGFNSTEMTSSLPMIVAAPLASAMIRATRSPGKIICSTSSTHISTTLKSGSWTSWRNLKFGFDAKFVSTSFGSKSPKSMLASDSATWSSRGLPSNPTRFQSNTR